MTKAPWIGLIATLALVALAVAVPLATGWQVHARADSARGVAPLYALWRPRVGVGTVPALALAVAGLRWGPSLAWRLAWRRLLPVSYAASLAWLVSLALVDGRDGIAGVLGARGEYLGTARHVTDLHRLLETYVARIPYSAAPHNWPVQIAGHPPGLVLFFVALVRIGLGGDLAAGLVVTALAATLPLAVLVTLRALDREDVGRRVAPFLVWTPSAIFLAVSGDAVIAVVVAWAMACLALAARPCPTASHATRAALWAVLAGLGFGAAVMMSYGLALAALPALAVLWAARRWWPVPVVALVALAVVLGFAAGGFSWWEAYPVLTRRYWDGIASSRPGGYWTWGDLAALAISGGPPVGAGLAATWARRHSDRVVTLLVGSAVLAVALADASQMSRAEVERIWLPFVPWLTLSVALLPSAWRRPALAGQILTALAVQHLLHGPW